MLGATVATPDSNSPPFDVDLVTGTPLMCSVDNDYGMQVLPALYGVIGSGVDTRCQLERPSDVAEHVERGSMILP